MFEPVGQRPQGQGLGTADRLGLGRAVGQRPRNGRHLGQPAAVVLQLGFDVQRHGTLRRKFDPLFTLADGGRRLQCYSGSGWPRVSGASQMTASPATYTSGTTAHALA